MPVVKPSSRKGEVIPTLFHHHKTGSKPPSQKNRMVTEEQQKVIAVLKAMVAANEQELSRAAAMNTANEECLQTLLIHIHALDIKPAPKKEMATICQRLLDHAAQEKRLNIKLTEADVRFISLLEKKYPVLNDRELRICLLIKLDYDNEEIARTANMKIRGMESIRFKMHRKLGLGKNDSIKNYFSNMTVS